MGQKRGLTAAAVERALLKALRSPRVRLRVAPLSDSDARADMVASRRKASPGPCLVTVDVHRTGLIPGVIHELLHYRWFWTLADWGDYEETVADAIEQAVWDRLRHDSVKRERWRRAIQGKLDEAGG